MRTLWGVLLALALLASASLTAAAQATPMGGVMRLPVTPNPAECTVAKPDIDQVLARVHETPIPGPALPATPVMTTQAPVVATPPPGFTLPQGTPADATTVSGVTAAMRELLACLNTGNALAVLPLTTDHFVRHLLQIEPVTRPEELTAKQAGTPPPMPQDEWSSLLAVWQVQVLPDGRVGALVARRVGDPPPPVVRVGYFVFVHAHGHYLLDAVVDYLEGQYPPPAISAKRSPESSSRLISARLRLAGAESPAR